MNVTFIIALTAGIVSFLSPCIFPVIPSYLTYIGGISLSEVEGNRHKRTVLLLNSLLFVLGFTIIFTLLGIFFSGVGIALSGASRYINMAAGIIVAFLGLNFIFDFWKLLNFEKRFHFSNRPGGKVGALFLGMAFGAGWTPCIGPILASILFLASGSGSVGRGSLLLVVYSIGLGLPFIIAGLFISRFRKLFSRMGKHLHTIKIASGIFLILIGILIFTGRLDRMNSFLFRIAGELDYINELYPLRIRLVSGFLLLATALLFAVSLARRLSRLRRSIEAARQERAGGEPATIATTTEGEVAGEEIPDKTIPDKDTSTGNEARFPYVRITFTFLFLLASILVFSGILDIAAILTGWLTFQGL